jgi:hypothetical protein
MRKYVTRCQKMADGTDWFLPPTRWKQWLSTQMSTPALHAVEGHDDRDPLEGAELHHSEELLMMNAKCVHPTTAPVSSQLTGNRK